MSNAGQRRQACTGVILAGGAASRMGGTAKGLALVGGIRIVDRVAAALRSAADALVVSTNDPRASEWLPGVSAVADSRTGFGALSGIHAALEATGTDILVLPWDCPFVPGDVLAELREAGEAHGAAIAAPASPTPWGYEPLCSWFAAHALEAVRAQLDAEDGRVGTLAERCALVTVDVAKWGDTTELFLNVNTPADLQRAADIAARHR